MTIRADDGQRGSRKSAPHETQQGAGTPGQRESVAAGNVADLHRTPSGHRSADPSSISIPHCEHCGKFHRIMIQMQPGRDGVPWQLCSPCWREGRQPFKLGMFKVTVIEDPHLADALAKASKRTAGLIDMTDVPDAPAAKTKKRR